MGNPFSFIHSYQVDLSMETRAQLYKTLTPCTSHLSRAFSQAKIMHNMALAPLRVQANVRRKIDV